MNAFAQWRAGSRRALSAIVFVAGLVVLPAQAAISQLVVFGDSLSDNGNLFAVTGTPPAPYFNGRFSNGPVAVEVMAKLLGVPLVDLAYGGAQTGTNVPASPLFSIPSVVTQVTQYLTGKPGIDGGALYMLWGGPNDLLGGLGVPGFDVAGAIGNGIANLKKAYDLLAAAGGKQFLVPLMPDLGITVRARGGGATQNLTVSAISSNWNALLKATFAGRPGVTVFDTFALSDNVWFSPSSFGLTNVLTSCLGASSVCSNPGQTYFWDDIHPTAAVHAILGTAFAGVFRVSEPGTLALLATLMLVGVVGVRRR